MHYQNKPKELPFCPRKQEVYRIFIKHSKRQVLRDMQEIIKANRKLPPDHTDLNHHLYTSEFIELIKLYGVPKGYIAPPGWEGLMKKEI